MKHKFDNKKRIHYKVFDLISLLWKLISKITDIQHFIASFLLFKKQMIFITIKLFIIIKLLKLKIEFKKGRNKND